MIYGIIYKITCVPTGKEYIGQTTVSMEKRWKEHVRHSRQKNRKNFCRYLANSIVKYGDKSFQIEILATAFSKTGLNEAEASLINTYNTSQPHGMNIDLGGRTVKRSQETNSLISKSIKAKWQDPNYRKNITISNSKSIVGINVKDGTQVQFVSLKEAGNVLGFNERNINAVIKGERASAGGYYWRYLE